MLKVVKPSKSKVVSIKTKKKRELPYAIEIYRKSQRSEDRNRKMTRRYGSLEKAFEGAHGFLMKYGYVKDACEVYCFESGLQAGTVEVTLKGRILTKYNLDLRKPCSMDLYFGLTNELNL